MNGLPEGFVLDNAALPEGFVIDSHPAQPSRPYGISDFLKDTVGSIARPIYKAVTALPTTAMDAGLQARNFLENPHIPSLQEINPFSEVGRSTGKYPSQGELANLVIDSMFAPPQTTLGKIGEFGSTMVAGAVLPSPKATSGLMQTTVPWKLPGTSLQSETASLAPTNYVPPKVSTFIKGNSEGYVAPPSNINPSIKNSFLEGIAGKLKTQQDASVINQSVTNRLAARALGQNDEAPLSLGAMQAIREEAHQTGYVPLRNIGQITPTQAYTDALDKITRQNQGASNSFPGIKGPDIEGIVAPFRQQSFNSSDAVDAISVLRGLADDAYSSGNKVAGQAYKGVSKALEGAIEQHLTDLGETGAELLSKFRDARTLMAKTYTVGKALNDQTGNVAAPVIARELARGKPLSGDLQTIGQFSQAFPKATRLLEESTLPISPLDVATATIGSAASHSVMPLLAPFARLGSRAYLLSAKGQAAALPSSAPAISPDTLNAFFGIGLPSLTK